MTKVKIDPKYLRCMPYIHEGQPAEASANAVRLIHKPSGIVVDCDTFVDLESNHKEALMSLERRLSEVYEKDYIEELNGLIQWAKRNVDGFNENGISDGYHTFNELYEFRKMYNAVLFNEWAVSKMSANAAIRAGWSVFDPGYAKHNVHKSWRHYDGELAFGGGWFIVSAMLPTGLISNHYKEKDWNLFQVPEVDKALYEFDGHTGKDVLQRLRDLKP